MSAVNTYLRYCLVAAKLENGIELTLEGNNLCTLYQNDFGITY
jgi:hypothetical protein